MVKKMELGRFNGKMAKNIQDHFKMVKCMEREVSKVMEKVIKDNFLKERKLMEYFKLCFMFIQVALRTIYLKMIMDIFVARVIKVHIKDISKKEKSMAEEK